MIGRNRDGASVSLGSTIQQAPSLFLLYWKNDTASSVPISTILEKRYSKLCPYFYYIGSTMQQALSGQNLSVHHKYIVRIFSISCMTLSLIAGGSKTRM